jgi:Tfp pilus assembly protein PilV
MDQSLNTNPAVESRPFMQDRGPSRIVTMPVMPLLKSPSGISLIEVCLTAFIIAVTAMLIVTFSKSTFNLTKDSRCSDVAYLSAEKKIAELGLQPFPAAAGNDKDTIDNIILTRTWTTATVNTIKRATVTVSYTIRSATRQISLTGAIN